MGAGASTAASAAAPSGNVEELLRAASTDEVRAFHEQLAPELREKLHKAIQKDSVEEVIEADDSKSPRDEDADALEDPFGGLRAIVAAGDIRFLSAKWLLSFEGIIKRRQDLEALDPNAYLALEDAAKFINLETSAAVCPRLIALSYGWIAPVHPDENGFHLKRLKRFLSCYLGISSRSTGGGDVGVFWDYPSLPQEPRSSEKETLTFKRGLKAINSLYGAPNVVTLQLKAMPQNMTPPPKPYHKRGWCHMEQQVSAIRKAPIFICDSTYSALVNDDELQVTIQSAGDLSSKTDLSDLMRHALFKRCLVFYAKRAQTTPERLEAELRERSRYEYMLNEMVMTNADGGTVKFNLDEDPSSWSFRAMYNSSWSANLEMCWHGADVRDETGANVTLPPTEDFANWPITLTFSRDEQKHSGAGSLDDFLSGAMSDLPPPRLPSDFVADLDLLSFTNGADKGPVGELYTAFFNQVAATTEKLNLPGTDVSVDGKVLLGTPHWDLDDIQKLARALPAFKRCETLCMTRRGLDDEKVRILMPALQCMPRLKFLRLKDNIVSEDVLHQLSEQCGIEWNTNQDWMD